MYFIRILNNRSDTFTFVNTPNHKKNLTIKTACMNISLRPNCYTGFKVGIKCRPDYYLLRPNCYWF